MAGNQRINRIGLLAGAGILAGGLLATASWISSDSLLEVGFARALAEMPGGATTVAVVNSGGAPVAGSEQFWLDGQPHPSGHIVRTTAGPARSDSQGKGLQVGQQLSLTGGDGTVRTYAVVEVQPVEGNVLRTATDRTGQSFVLVVWREVGKAAAEARVLRMIVDPAGFDGAGGLGEGRVL